MANVALLATIADAKASQATQTVSPVMPTGVILPYGGNTAPSGWLVCDGAEYSQTTYADLFAALGSTYNTQLNPVTGSNWAAPSGGNFRVPDMRGMFMRGEGTPSGLDAVSVGGSQVDKTKPNGLTNANSTLSGGSISVNKNQWNNDQTAHSHAQSGSDVAGANTGWRPGHDFGSLTTSTSTVTASASWSSVNATGTASGTATAQAISGDNETRPMNRGVKYIIKV